MKKIILLLMLVATECFAAPRVFDYRVVLGKDVTISTDFFNATLAESEKEFLDKFGIQLRLKRVILDQAIGEPTSIDSFVNADRYIYWNKKYRNVLYRKLFTSIWVSPFIGPEGTHLFAGQADSGQNQFNGISMITPEPKDQARTSMIFSHEMAHNFGCQHINDSTNIMHADAQKICKENYSACEFTDFSKVEVLSWIYLTTKLKRRCRYFYRKHKLTSPVCYQFAN